MRHLVLASLALFLLSSGPSRQAAAQELLHVNLVNRSHGPIWILAYDPICAMRVFEAVLIERGSTTVKVCADKRKRGNIVIYDRRGRSLTFSGILNKSDVNIRFR